MVESRMVVLGKQALVVDIVYLLRPAGAWLLDRWPPGGKCRAKLGATVQRHPSQDYTMGRGEGWIPWGGLERLLLEGPWSAPSFLGIVRSGLG